MRRPLRPFVTEYKQSTRRPQSLAEQGAPEPDRSAIKSIDFGPPASDESYEAALRAADALFADPAAMPVRENPLPTPSAETAAPSVETLRPEKNGGRILRVIHEAPPPELAALEAERTPKRRGRKPGSKNKPKVALVAGQSAPAGHSARSRAGKGVPAPAVSVPPTPVARVEALVAASRPAKRAGWGRDRLRPGEDWKRRRLPRVCW